MMNDEEKTGAGVRGKRKSREKSVLISVICGQMFFVGIRGFRGLDFGHQVPKTPRIF
jgi:hypothetical protein